MLKRYTFWLWLAVVFLSLTGVIHSIGLFIRPTPGNEVERQMLDLMMNYKQDFGAGFHTSMWNLFIALSSCFTFLCLLGGLTLAYLLKKRVAPDVLKGIVRIQLLVFGICFIVMSVLTFLPPIVLTGLCVLFLAIGSVMFPGRKQSIDSAPV
jgi:ABC-type spermidine/putrescine transport system permease subunit I